MPERTARYWQKVAEIPEDKAIEYIAETKESDGAEITTAGLLEFDKHSGANGERTRSALGKIL